MSPWLLVASCKKANMERVEEVPEWVVYDTVTLGLRH